MQKQERNVQKKRDVRAKLLFCLLNQLTFSLPSASLDLKVPVCNVKVVQAGEFDRFNSKRTDGSLSQVINMRWSAEQTNMARVVPF